MKGTTIDRKKELRRARREIDRGNVSIRGRDEYGRPHSRVRTLGHLDWRLESGKDGRMAVIPGPAAVRKHFDPWTAPVAPMEIHYWLAG